MSYFVTTYNANGVYPNADIDTARWVLIRTSGNTTEITYSDQSIEIANEQLLPSLGISIRIEQYDSKISGTTPVAYLPALLPSSIEFADSSKRWLSGIEDQDGANPRNWIRSGTADESETFSNAAYPPAPQVGYYNKCEDPFIFNDEVTAYDETEIFEKVVELSLIHI